MTNVCVPVPFLRFSVRTAHFDAASFSPPLISEIKCHLWSTSRKLPAPEPFQEAWSFERGQIKPLTREDQRSIQQQPTHRWFFSAVCVTDKVSTAKIGSRTEEQQARRWNKREMNFSREKRERVIQRNKSERRTELFLVGASHPSY